MVVAFVKVARGQLVEVSMLMFGVGDASRLGAEMGQKYEVTCRLHMSAILWNLSFGRYL